MRIYEITMTPHSAALQRTDIPRIAKDSSVAYVANNPAWHLERYTRTGNGHG